jgi:hypothetical protein
VIPTAQDWPAAPLAPPPPPPTAAHGYPPRRRRPVFVALAAAGALVAGAAVGATIGILTRSPAAVSPGTPRTPSAPSAAAVRAAALYRQALTAANGSAGFHYVATTSGDSSNQKFIGDAGQAAGTQVITLDSTYGHEQFTLMLLGGTVYFQGNAPSLRDQLGVSATSAPGVAGTWVSVTSADGPYGVIAPGITVGDQVGETLLVPTSSQTLPGGGVRIAGTLPARAAATGTAHLDVAAGTHLPRTYVVSTTARGTTTTSTTVFSGWGTRPTVTAPAGAVAWATLGASTPPGGYGSGGNSTSPTPAA